MTLCPPTLFKMNAGSSDKVSRWMDASCPHSFALEGLSSRDAPGPRGHAVLLAVEWSWQSLPCPCLSSGCFG